jgi:hypothetical protein
VIADDVIAADPEGAVRRIASRLSLARAVAVCRAVRPIDCRRFVDSCLPDKIEYMRLLQDPVTVEELAVSVLCRLEVRQWGDRARWARILARLRPFVVAGQNSGLLHALASDLLALTFDEAFDLRTFRGIPPLAERYGLFRVQRLLRELGSSAEFPVCPHFAVVPPDAARDLRPLGRAPAVPDLDLDSAALTAAFRNNSAIVPVFLVTHAARQTRAFRNAPAAPLRPLIKFAAVAEADPEALFAQAVGGDCVRELCDAYVNAEAHQVLFAFFCGAVSRALWRLAAAIARWMAGRYSLFFERFTDHGERREFIRLLIELLDSAPILERRGIPSATIFPPAHITQGSIEDLRTLVLLHQLQQTMDGSIFEPQAFNALMKQGRFEVAFSIARARRVDITATFFAFASRERDLCRVILKIIPYLSDAQLERVIQSVAPILEMTTSSADIDAFMKQLICTIGDESRVFHVLLWFERIEEALFFAVFHDLRPCVAELWGRARLTNDLRLEQRCRKFMRMYRMPTEDAM